MKITETCLDLLSLDIIEIAENRWVLLSTVLQVMGLAESYWDLISLAESYWVLLSLAENCKVLLSLAELCWVLLRFVMHCWVCWVLLSLTESSLVLLSIVETFLIIFNHFAYPTSSSSFTKGFWIGHYTAENTENKSFHILMFGVTLYGLEHCYIANQTPTQFPKLSEFSLRRLLLFFTVFENPWNVAF